MCALGGGGRSRGCGSGTDPARTQPPHKALHHGRRGGLGGHQAWTQGSGKERPSPTVSRSLPDTQRHFQPHLRQRPHRSRRRPGFRDLAHGVWIKMGGKWFWLQSLAMFRFWFRVKKSIKLDLGNQSKCRPLWGITSCCFPQISLFSRLPSSSLRPGRGLLVPAVGHMTACAAGGLRQ